MGHLLEVKDICKTYVIDKRQNNVLRNVEFVVNDGEMVAIMGPSGSGKSTLLYSVSGMDNPTSGTVIFDGTDITKLKDKDYDYIEEEMKEIVAICKKHNVISKVIFENCYLTKDEIIILCNIAKKIKPDYIKTSTGFGTYGARIEDVELMKSIVGDTVKIKAAGGIRDWNTCKEMIEAGASRIGTSSSFKILEEYEKENNKL